VTVRGVDLNHRPPKTLNCDYASPYAFDVGHEVGIVPEKAFELIGKFRKNGELDSTECSGLLGDQGDMVS